MYKLCEKDYFKDGVFSLFREVLLHDFSSLCGDLNELRDRLSYKTSALLR